MHLHQAAIVAHQGGWDEIAFVAAPLIVFAGLLYLANKRAEKQSAQQKPDPKDTSSRR